MLPKSPTFTRGAKELIDKFWKSREARDSGSKLATSETSRPSDVRVDPSANALMETTTEDSSKPDVKRRSLKSTKRSAHRVTRKHRSNAVERNVANVNWEELVKEVKTIDSRGQDKMVQFELCVEIYNSQIFAVSHHGTNSHF